MALEALNDAGSSKTNIIVILNDNEMSISKNVGGVPKLLTKIRTKKMYKKSNNSIKRFFNKIPIIGKPIVNLAHKIKNGIKHMIIPNMYFEDIGFTYLGPVSGKLINVKDEAGNEASYKYDELDNLVKIRRHGTEEDRITEYTRDSFGNVIRIKDQLGNDASCHQPR